MEALWPAIPAAVLLACPLMMVGMGVGAWFFARVRGEKRSLSVGCMPGMEHGESSKDAVPATGESQNVHAEAREPSRGSL